MATKMRTFYSRYDGREIVLEKTKRNASDEYKAKHFPITTLQAVYATHSFDKEYALNRCKSLQYELDGHNGSILSANGWKFTYGFFFEETDHETGEIVGEYFCKITKDHNYYWEV